MRLSIYVVISLVLIVLFVLDIKTKREKDRRRFFYFGAFLCTALLAFRGEYIGGDTPNYLGYFNGTGGGYGTIDTNDTFEWGFVFFCKMLRLISTENFWFLFATSLVTMLPFLYMVKRDTEGSKILPLCQYMLLWYILSTTQTALRQNLSVACLMTALAVWTSTMKKKPKLYTTIALLVYGFLSHNSSFMAYPLFIIGTQIRFTKKSALLSVIIPFVLVLAVENVFFNAFSVFYDIMGNVKMLSKFFDIYYLNGYDFEYEVSFNRLFPLAAWVCLLIYMSDEDERKTPYFRLLVFGTALYMFGASFPMLNRTAYPILFSGIVFCPKIVRHKPYALYRLAIIVILLFFVQVQSRMKPGQDDQMYPYTFIWEDNNVKTLKSIK